MMVLYFFVLVVVVSVFVSFFSRTFFFDSFSLFLGYCDFVSFKFILSINQYKQLIWNNCIRIEFQHSGRVVNWFCVRLKGNIILKRNDVQCKYNVLCSLKIEYYIFIDFTFQGVKDGLVNLPGKLLIARLIKRPRHREAINNKIMKGRLNIYIHMNMCVYDGLHCRTFRIFFHVCQFN